MPVGNKDSRPAGEGDSRTARTHVFEGSDSGIVPMNHSNKHGKLFAENEEGRPLIKENTHQPNTYPTRSGTRVSQGLAGVRRAAREGKETKFTALLHHLTVDLLRESFYALKRKAAPGVDGVTWQEYETGLDGRLVDLHSRVHRGAYRAKPSRRAIIPKPDGRQRPLGVAALEDKVVQQAVVTILNQIYEEDFRGFSYGFRPGRSPHQALDALTVALKRRKVSYVLDADIRGFFDHLDHGWMMKFVQHRVADPRILRLIQKWLKAGVMEGGQWSETEMGTPQGAVISPLLANIYLHYVFDLWVDVWRKKCAQGDVIVIRYADDNVLGFQHQTEADRFLEDFRERLGKFGLELHPDKTRRIEFGRVCRTAPETKRGRQARNVRLSGFHAHQRDDPEGVLYRKAPDVRQTYEGETAADQAATSLAYAPPGGANGRVAQIGRERLLQLLRGPGKYRQPGRVSGKGDSAVARDTNPPKPETKAPLDSNAHLGGSMDTPPARAPPVSRVSLRRQVSEIRAVWCSEAS